jgi:hypothetical protein
MRNRDMERDGFLRSYDDRMRGSAEYHKGLRSLSISEHSRKKFELSGAAKFLTGFSVVQWIDSQTELGANLQASEEQLRQDFRAPWIDAEGNSQPGIAGKLAFLPASTYHMTIYDLVVEPTEEVCRELPGMVGNSVFPALKHEISIPPEMWSEGILVMGETSIAAMLHPMDRRSLETLCRIRQKHHELLHGLGDAVANQPPYDFFGHITLAYIIDDLSEPEYNWMLRILSRYESRMLGRLRVDRVELRWFNSMVDWLPSLAALRLQGGTP